MYLQGVSTRKVTKIMEQLCGLDVTSTQVSRAAAELDEQLQAWRNRPLSEVRYLILDACYEKVRHGEGGVLGVAAVIAYQRYSAANLGLFAARDGNEALGVLELKGIAPAPAGRNVANRRSTPSPGSRR